MKPFYYTIVVVFLIHTICTDGQETVDYPVRVPAKNLRGIDPDTCPTDQEISDAKNELRMNISVILANIPTDIPSSCGGTGWRRVGYLDMTDPSQSCPPGLALKSLPVRACGQVTSSAGCWSTLYSTNGFQYDRVCGRIRGYQFGQTSAFFSASQGIDSYYVEGVSLTHGPSGSRTHIWTFAADLSEVFDGINTNHYCKCVTTFAPQPPLFVGNDYFCESGFNSVYAGGANIFYPSDPLWDGQNCVSSCCEFNNPPYFTKSLPTPTTDDIELRICSHGAGTREDTPIDQVELYVR